jgi:hypothetical protein
MPGSPGRDPGKRSQGDPSADPDLELLAFEVDCGLSGLGSSFGVGCPVPFGDRPDTL